MENQIRDYLENDFNEVNQLWVDTGMSSSVRGDDAGVIAKTLKNGGYLRILFNSQSGEIIGTSWLTNDRRRLYLHHFGIKPSYQGRGFSKILLRDSLDLAEKAGLQLKIEVHRDNQIALSLYKKFGFKYLGDYEVYIIREFGLNNKIR